MIHNANSPPIRRALRLFNLAKRKGRDGVIHYGMRAQAPGRPQPSACRLFGLEGANRRPAHPADAPLQSGAGRSSRSGGFRIIVNVGDQESDLVGGHADLAFRLPNRFYFTP